MFGGVLNCQQKWLWVFINDLFLPITFTCCQCIYNQGNSLVEYASNCRYDKQVIRLILYFKNTMRATADFDLHHDTVSWVHTAYGHRLNETRGTPPPRSRSCLSTSRAGTRGPAGFSLARGPPARCSALRSRRRPRSGSLVYVSPDNFYKFFLTMSMSFSWFLCSWSSIIWFVYWTGC